MNRITSLITLLLLIVSSSAFAQDKAALKASALRDAKITSEATLNLDFETVFKHTYPNIIEIMGGKDQALELLKTAFETMKSQGLLFEKAEIKHVSDIVFENEQYRCYIEGFNQMKMGNLRIKSKSYLLGIYNLEGGFWYFLEAEKLKNKALTDMILPNFKTSLNIPEDQMTTEEI